MKEPLSVLAETQAQLFVAAKLALRGLRDSKVAHKALHELVREELDKRPGPRDTRDIDEHVEARVRKERERREAEGEV